MTLHYEDGGLRLFHGKNMDILGADALGYPFGLGYHTERLIPDASYESIVTDPPYELGFMGKGWDSSGIAYDVDVWRECFRVLKPGGYLLSFGGTRTWHRIAVAIEDAGFEVRDSIAWMYGSGFPKSMDVSKEIDKAAGVTREVVGKKSGRGAKPTNDMRGGKYGSTKGAVIDTSAITAPSTEAAREWEGWGTGLKPAFEPIIVARKPMIGTYVTNVLAHGTGALNIDANRVGDGSDSQGDRPAHESSSATRYTGKGGTNLAATPGPRGGSPSGRFPSNVLLDESQATELDRQAPDTGGSGKASGPTLREPTGAGVAFGARNGLAGEPAFYGGEKGGASRFFPTFRYVAKAPGSERPEVDGMAHATVKPLELMRWLVRLVTRKGGRVLDLYAGSGTTGEAALLEGMEVDLIELEEVHLPLILQRVRKPLQPSMFGDWEGGAA